MFLEKLHESDMSSVQFLVMIGATKQQKVRKANHHDQEESSDKWSIKAIIDNNILECTTK
jgi:hypothetical protein